VLLVTLGGSVTKPEMYYMRNDSLLSLTYISSWIQTNNFVRLFSARKRCCSGPEGTFSCTSQSPARNPLLVPKPTTNVWPGNGCTTASWQNSYFFNSTTACAFWKIATWRERLCVCVFFSKRETYTYVSLSALLRLQNGHVPILSQGKVVHYNTCM